MRKLSQFEKLGLVAAVIVACTYFYMKRVYEPQEKVLKKTVATLNGVIKEFNALAEVPPVHAVKARIKKRKEELAEREQSLEGMTVQTGAQREVTELLGQIVDLIRARNLTVKALAPAREKLKEPLYEWNVFSVDMEGDFGKFTDLLARLRNLNDPVKIDKVAIGRGEGRDLSIRFNVMI
ncbi:hypothetical protein JCM14469_25040 [Desulfatiferula olefinivorans]